MATAQEISNRIKSIEETRKIANAMYMISSSKVRQARRDLEATAPFFFAQQKSISRFIDEYPDVRGIYFGKDKAPEDMVRGYIVVTADKGLAGAYNHNILKLASEELAKGKHNRLFVVGELGRQYFLSKGMDIDGEFGYTVQNPTLYRARRIADQMQEMYYEGDLDEVYIVYTQLVNPFRMDPTIFRLLPLNRGHYVLDEEELEAKYKVQMNFHSTVEAVFDNLIPNVVSGYIYGALVESFASEQNSRMMAMQTATNSADDMLHDLQIEYNRVRQASITQEITEVIAGAQAQRSKKS